MFGISAFSEQKFHAKTKSKVSNTQNFLIIVSIDLCQSSLIVNRLWDRKLHRIKYGVVLSYYSMVIKRPTKKTQKKKEKTEVHSISDDE